MEYRVIRLINGQWDRTEGDIENIIPAMEIRGYRLIGFESHPQRRAELQGLPMFEGLHGPMWDGNAIRYEDPAAYNALSQ